MLRVRRDEDRDVAWWHWADLLLVDNVAERLCLFVPVGVAATKLGISEEMLITAWGDPQKGPPHLAPAAVSLELTEAELLDALGRVEDQGSPAGGPPKD
ncbi:hypothetical protein P3T73_08275 [Kiritimatiellota bacterium B12222]|nr:hypothetical protein P3T73_08275 [Kiritimatiellota bacterium B12222]